MTKSDLTIREIASKEDMPYDLLLLADPSKEAIDDYLHRGTCFVASIDNEIIGIYILLPTRPFTVELVNIAIKEACQQKGYGKKLVKHAVDMAKNRKYRVMEIGTGNSGTMQLALYQKCGFTITSVDIDFFRKHYPEPIFENGIECRHMIRLSMDL